MPACITSLQRPSLAGAVLGQILCNARDQSKHPHASIKYALIELDLGFWTTISPLRRLCRRSPRGNRRRTSSISTTPRSQTGRPDLLQRRSSLPRQLRPISLQVHRATRWTISCQYSVGWAAQAAHLTVEEGWADWISEAEALVPLYRRLHRLRYLVAYQPLLRRPHLLRLSNHRKIFSVCSNSTIA